MFVDPPERRLPSTEASTSVAGWAGAIPSDTTSDANRIQREIYRSLSGRERVAIMFRLSEAVRRLSLAGIRARHPDYSDTRVREAYARLVLGDGLTQTVWPDRELVDP